MSILEFIGEIGRAEKIYRKPNIPRGKADNAILSYCSKLRYNDIEVLIDETVFGNAKAGIIITANAIYGKESFCDPFQYSLDKITSILAKKSLVTTSIYINQRPVIKLTQPTGAALVYLFNRIEHYLKHMKAIPKIATEDYPETRSPAPQPCEVTLLTEVEASVETHIPKSENQPNEDSTPLNIEMKQPSSCFRQWPKDSLIQSIKKDKNINTVFNFIGDVLSDNKSSKTETLRREVSGFLSKSTLRLRKEYIDLNDIKGLMNDIATLELTIFSIALLRHELESRRIDPRVISYSLNEGVKHLLSLDNSSDSTSNLEVVLYLAESMGDSIDEIYFSFYLRMMTSNMKGALASADFESNNLRSVCHHNKELPMDQALDNLINELVLGAASEIGDVSMNRNIGYDARYCADKIIDLF